METKNTRESYPEGLTSDEKLMALLSHLSFFICGVFVPLVIYFVYKGKSKFIMFNALQATFFQLSCIATFFALALIGGFIAGSSGIDLKFFILIIYFLLAAFFVIYSIYVGIKSFQGEIIIYPIVGESAYKGVYNIRD